MSQEWYYAKGGQRLGPVSAQRLKELAVSGNLRHSDLVWRAGLSQWVKAKEIQGLFPTTPVCVPQPTMSPPPMPSNMPNANTPAAEHSTGRAKLYGAVVVAVLVVFMTCLHYFAGSDNNLGTCLTFNRGQLFYKAPVSETEAKRLGLYLVENKFFNGEPKSVQITKTNEKYVFRMVLKKGFQPSAFMKESARVFGSQVSQVVFQSAPVEVQVCDDRFKTISILPPLSSGESPEKAIESAVHQRIVSLAAICDAAEHVIANENASARERSKAIDDMMQAVNGIRNEIDFCILTLDRVPANELTSDDQADLSTMRQTQTSLQAAVEALQRMKAAGGRAEFEANWKSFQGIIDSVLPPDSAGAGSD